MKEQFSGVKSPGPTITDDECVMQELKVEKIKLPESVESYTHLLIQADSLEYWEAVMPWPQVNELHEIQIKIGEEVRSASLRLIWEKLGKDAIHPICPKCKGFGDQLVKKQSFTIDGVKWAIPCNMHCYYCHGHGRLLPGQIPGEPPEFLNE